MTPRTRTLTDAELCSDCPPLRYPTDKTRCDSCPRRIPPIDEQAQQLEAAGWKQKGVGRWMAPNGALYLGPFQAWKAMNGILLHEGVFGDCRDEKVEKA